MGEQYVPGFSSEVLFSVEGEKHEDVNVDKRPHKNLGYGQR